MTSFPFLSPGSTIGRKITTVSLSYRTFPRYVHLRHWFISKPLMTWSLSLLGHYHPKSFSWVGKICYYSFYPLLTLAQPLLITKETEPFCLSFQFLVHFKENILSIVIHSFIHSFIHSCTKGAYYELGSALGSVIYPYTKCIFV